MDKDKYQRLEQEIEKARRVHEEDKGLGGRSKTPKMAALGKGMRVITELAAPMAVAGYIGYLADDYFNTKPAIFVIMILLGIATGFWNVYRYVVVRDKD